MFVVYYILTIFLSSALGATIGIKKELSKWDDFKSKYSNYSHLIEFGKESKCFAEDSIHFGDFYQGLYLGFDLANALNLSELTNNPNLANYEMSLKNKTDEKSFCQQLHDKMLQDSNFSKLLLEKEACLAFCFCKTDLLDDRIPDKGCVLLDYIYSKIKDNRDNNRKDETVKSNELSNLPKVEKTETIKKSEKIIPSNSKEDTLKTPKLQNTTQKKTIENETEVKSDIFTTKPESEEKTQEITSKLVENAKQTPSSISNNIILTDEEEANTLFNAKTEKSTETEKNIKVNNEELIPPIPDQPDNEESYENEEENIQNTDNNVPKVEQSQAYHNTNDNEYQKNIISTKYYAVEEDAGSNFFTYLFMGMFLTIVFYVIYHNKTKILALILEGRRGKSGRGRRKHTASYSKLDSNLEEAISSPYSGRSSQIIY